MPRILTTCLLICSCAIVADFVRGEDKTPPLAVAPFDAKTALQHQQAWAKHLKLDVEVQNKSKMTLRLIPPGEFQMGSVNRDFPDQSPPHRVRISKPFLLGKFEVSQKEWVAVMGTTPWKGKDSVKEGDNFAASYITPEDAIEFCRKQSQKEGHTYRLPTEAEWEYACRAGTATPFSYEGGKAAATNYGWFDVNTWDVEQKYAHEVGKKKPNPFGLHDMHGNVWEFCHDWYDETYYSKSPLIDPPGPQTKSQRVTRGNGWLNSAGTNGSSFRLKYQPENVHFDQGLRVARTLGAQ